MRSLVRSKSLRHRFEWWDERIIWNPRDTTKKKFRIRTSRITQLVEHMAVTKFPRDSSILLNPFKMRRKDIKKIRNQHRIQREQERQELVLQGLIERNKIKQKMTIHASTLMAKCVFDPTHLEHDLEKDMEERKQAHEDRNLARKLTPLEVKEKKERRMYDDKRSKIPIMVYRITYPDPSFDWFKVDINAVENRLSGVCLITNEMALIIVEGCSKSQARYEKLILNRMKWEATAKKHLGLTPSAANTVSLLWKGSIKARTFTKFRLYKNLSNDQAKKILHDHCVEHFWDLAISINEII
jgi:U4/U6 small nuclear ribonucleoprotein PRP3